MAMSHNKTTRTLFAAGGALLALVALTGCSGGSSDDAEPEDRSFPLAGDQLTIAKDSGDLDVRPADVEEVEVTRWFSGGSGIGGGAEATWELAGDTLTLTTRCGGMLGQCDVRYEVLVPWAVTLTVEGENGTISAAGFETDLAIRSDNGAVSVEDASGDLTLNSDNGELRGTGIASSRVDAGSENGQVRLTFAVVPDQVEVTTENGAVTVEVPDAAYNVTTVTDSGEVSVDVPEDANSERTITARTDNGAITLRIAG